MATLNSAKRNTSGYLEAGYKSNVRLLDFYLDLAVDVTMGTATDVIQLGTLPIGSVVVAASVQQVVAGTGTGTLVLSIGGTTVSATLASTAAANNWAATVPAAIPLVLNAAGEIALTGATAVRTDGKIRVVVAIVEGDRTPRIPVTVDRDQLS